MTRAAGMLLIALSLASCTLDLARLRAGAGGDAAGVDASETDARTPDAGDLDASADADVDAPPDAGRCPCFGGIGFQTTVLSIPGSSVSHLQLVDVDLDGDEDIAASIDGAATSGLVVVRMANEGCSASGLTGTSSLVPAVAGGLIAALADIENDRVADVLPPIEDHSYLYRYRGVIVSGDYTAVDERRFETVAGLRATFAVDLELAREHAIVGLGDGVVYFMRFDGEGTMTGAPVLGVPSTGTFRRASFAYEADRSRMRVAFALPQSVEDVALTLPATFGSSTSYPLPTADLRDVVVVDLGEGSGLSIVAADASAGSPGVHVFLGHDGAALQVPGRATLDLDVGDFDGNGMAEVAAVHADAIELYGWDTRSRSLRSGSTISTGGGATALGVGDVDDDGQDDIVVGRTNEGGAVLTIYRHVCPG